MYIYIHGSLPLVSPGKPTYTYTHTHINTYIFILLSFLLQRVSVKNLEESRKNYFSSHNLPFKSDLRKKKKKLYIDCNCQTISTSLC